jgi:hypothetical protein
MKVRNMNNEKLEIIIDGANIFHDDRGIRTFDEDGEKITQSRPERLAAAISFCEGKGWKATAVLKQMSYYIATKLKDSGYVGDMNIVDDLISKKKIMLISKKKEDIYFINLAIQRNAYILTRDGFKEEREKYPDLDWEDIDNRTLNGYEFLGEDFVLPGLPERTADLPIEVSYADFKELNDKVEFLENKIQMIEDSQMIQKASLKGEAAEIPAKDIAISVVDTTLKGGQEILMHTLLSEVSRAVLGPKKAIEVKSGKLLRTKLGYSKSKGFLAWIIELSNNKIKHRTKGGKLYIRYG